MEKKYCVRYEGNNSRKWDGREIMLDGNWLEELYEPSQILPGMPVRLPWPKKHGGIEYWLGVIVEPAVIEPAIADTAVASAPKGGFIAA